MEYICTTCCKEKRVDENPLPAIDRYLSPRIQFVFAESRRLNKPFIILSGKYGLLEADDKIPWYDKKLMAEEVDQLVPTLVAQLTQKGITKIIFCARPRTTPGWEPYYEAIERACAQLGIPLAYQQVR